MVYARSKFHHNAGGCVFSLRGKGQGSGGFTMTFRNIVVEDPRPTHMHFKIMMTALPPWGDPEDRTRGPGDIYGITFQEKISRTTRTISTFTGNNDLLLVSLYEV